MKKFTIILTMLIAITVTTKAQWQQTNGTAGKKITSFALSGTNVFAGTYGGTQHGVLLSTNDGSDWSATGMTSNIFALTVCGSYIFAGNESVGLSVSSNNGTSWTPANNGLAPGTQIVALTTSGLNIYAGAANGIYLSNNNGLNWSAINNGLTNTNVTSIIAVSPYLSSGTNGGGVFASSDNGSNWSANNSGLTNLNVRTLGFTSANILFAGTSGGVFVFDYGGTNTWSAVNNGLTNLDVNTLIANGTDIYAGTQGGGLFKTTDNGANWISVNTGLPSNDILSLAITGGYLLVGTTSEGVWKRSLSELTGIAETNLNSIIAVYPNPASDIVTFNIDNTNNADLTLNIYNVIGTLVKSEILKQNNRQINIEDLNNGIYVVEINSKELKGRRKLLIQR